MKTLGEMNINSVKAVCGYFASHNTGKASDIGISGAFASSFVSRNYLRVVGKEEGFVHMGGDMYRKVTVNVYALANGVTAEKLYEAFVYSVELNVNREADIASAMIAKAQCRLAEAQNLLASVRS